MRRVLVAVTGLVVGITGIVAAGSSPAAAATDGSTPRIEVSTFGRDYILLVTISQSGESKPLQIKLG